MTSPARSRRGDTCLSDFQIDALLAAEGPATAAARAHASGCDRCQRRWADIETQRHGYLRAHPSWKFPSRQPSAWRGGRAWLTAAAALVLVAGTLTLWRRAGDQTSQPSRTKGGSALGFYVKHGNAVFRGGDGQVVHPGDELRFVVRSTKSHVAIVSVDGNRDVSIYFPAQPRTAAVKADQDLALPDSIRLDSVLGRETVYGLFCDGPTDLNGVRDGLRAQPAAQPAVGGCEVATLTISKVP